MYEYDATEIAFKNGYKKCAMEIIAYLKEFDGYAKAAAEELESRYTDEKSNKTTSNAFSQENVNK